MGLLHVFDARVDHMVRDRSPHSPSDFGPLEEVGRVGRLTRSSDRFRNYELPVRTPVRLPEDQDRERFNFTGGALPIETLSTPQASRVSLNCRGNLGAFVLLQRSIHPASGQVRKSVPVSSCMSPDQATAMPVYRAKGGHLRRGVVQQRGITPLAGSSMRVTKSIQARADSACVNGWVAA